MVTTHTFCNYITDIPLYCNHCKKWSYIGMEEQGNILICQHCLKVVGAKEEEIQQFQHTASTKKPAFHLIPYHALSSMADRFKLGSDKYGDKAWNVGTSQAGLEDEAWLEERASHIISHVYQWLMKRKGLIPVDDDDDAGAIMWGGACLSEAGRVKNDKKTTSIIDKNEP